MIYFDSERLIFRDWKEEDLSEFRKMNADPIVMEYFPSTLTHSETDAFYVRIKENMQRVGYGLYAVEVKETGAFIGFIGFHQANLNLGFDPFVEIGWRLKKEAWGMGYAQEGAKRCLAYGFENLGFTEVYSFTSTLNARSERVMRSIGMTKQMTFDHPRIDKKDVLCEHVLYRIKNERVD